jgi:hypothetical protein
MLVYLQALWTGKAKIQKWLDTHAVSLRALMVLAGVTGDET